MRKPATSWWFLLLVLLLTPVLEAWGESTSDKLQKGINLAKARKYAEAEQVFVEVLQDDPMSGKAHYYLALACWKEGKKSQASQELSLLQDLDGSLAANLKKLCPGIESAAGATEAPPSSRDATSPAVGPAGALPAWSVPGNPSPGGKPAGSVAGGPSRMTGLDLARELQRAGRLDDAIAQFRIEVKTAQDRDAVRLELGQCLEDSGQNPEAIKTYGQVLGEDARWEAMWRIGRIYRGEGRFQKAREAYALLETDGCPLRERAQAAIQEIDLEQAARKPEEKEAGGQDGSQEDEDEKRRLQLWEETNADDPEVQERAYQSLLSIDPNDRIALLGIKDLMKEQGKFWRMRKYLYELVKKGHMSQGEADAEINDYEGSKD